MNKVTETQWQALREYFDNLPKRSSVGHADDVVEILEAEVVPD